MTEVMGVKIGQRSEFTKTVTADDVQKFAEVTGDTNPLHSDPEYAKKTRFGECIAHGMLSAGFISAVLGTKLAPDACAVYLSQTLRFIRPVKIGDTITAVATVKGVEDEKRTFTIETECHNQDGESVVKGEAVILLDPVN
ncbi:MAG TPA: MaoC family dehydratase [Dehalococcoidia bacterium]|nr:MaoC family dehydratase [Dehalococcoidia bacterium]